MWARRTLRPECGMEWSWTSVRVDVCVCECERETILTRRTSIPNTGMGKNDGSVRGKVYFKTLDKRGVFLKREALSVAEKKMGTVRGRSSVRRRAVAGGGGELGLVCCRYV